MPASCARGRNSGGVEWVGSLPEMRAATAGDAGGSLPEMGPGRPGPPTGPRRAPGNGRRPGRDVRRAVAADRRGAWPPTDAAPGRRPGRDVRRAVAAYCRNGRRPRRLAADRAETRAVRGRLPPGRRAAAAYRNGAWRRAATAADRAETCAGQWPPGARLPPGCRQWAAAADRRGSWPPTGPRRAPGSGRLPRRHLAVAAYCRNGRRRASGRLAAWPPTTAPDRHGPRSAARQRMATPIACAAEETLARKRPGKSPRMTVMTAVIASPRRSSAPWPTGVGSPVGSRMYM